MSAINPSAREPGRRVRRPANPRGRDRARVRALALLAALLVVSAVAVWLVVRSDAKGGETPAAAPCGAASGPASTVKLRVLNATPREGLAASVAAELRKRGFFVISVGNDSHQVPGPAEVRHGPKGASAARLVASLVSGSTTRKDSRPGTDVDLVLGTKFSSLAAAKPGAAKGGCPATAKPTVSPRKS